MQLFKRKGNRIRASDKSLVFRFAAGSLLLLFFMAMILLNLMAIITTDWNSVTLFSNGNLQFHLTPYRIVTLIISAFTCLAAALLYYRFRYDKVKQLFHRQKLARMILENGWYEAETSQDSGIFKDLPSDGKKERITYFPDLQSYHKARHIPHRNHAALWIPIHSISLSPAFSPSVGAGLDISPA